MLTKAILALLLWSVQLCTVKATTMSFTQPSYSVSEGGSSVSVCVRAEPAPINTVEVTLSSSEEFSQDLSVSSPVTQNFTAANPMLCWTVNAVDDDIFEITELVSLEITSSIPVEASATINIEDNDVVTVQMNTADEVRVNESVPASLCATIENSPTLEREVVVQLTTTNTDVKRPATPDTDYQSIVPDMTFSPGETMQCVDVQTVSDRVYEFAEYFIVSLSTPDINSRVHLGSMTSTAVRIVDMQRATVFMTRASIRQAEAEGDVQVCAQLNTPADGLQYSTEREIIILLNGNNGNMLIFPVGSQTGNTLCLTLTVTIDDVFQPNPLISEVYNLGKATGQGRIDIDTNRMWTTVVVNDDDDAVVSMSTSTLPAQTEGSVVQVCASLTSPPGGTSTDITVRFTWSSTLTDTATFIAGSQRNSQACVMVSVADDQTYGTSLISSYIVRLSIETPNSRVTVGNTPTTTFSVIDNDNVVISMVTETVMQTEADGNVDDVCASVTTPVSLSRPITVRFTRRDNNSVMMQTFPMGPVTTPGVCASYAVTDNNIYQHSPVQSFTVMLSLAESNTRIRIAGITQTIVTINDDDAPIIRLEQASYTFNETTPQETGMICAVLMGPAGGLATSLTVPVSFTVIPSTATAGVDYSVSGPITGVFDSSDTVGSKRCISVTIIDDNTADPDETFSVNISTGTHTDSATVTIINNDLFPTPRNLRNISTSSTAVVLEWNPPESNSFDQTLTSYTVTWNDESSRTTPQQQATINNLIPFQHYRFSVNANFEGGNIGESVSISVTTLQAAPGTPPTNLAAATSTTSSLTLSWSPPSQPNGVITGYTLYVNRTLMNTLTTTNMMVTISPLRPYQTVSVQVSANTSVGEGPKTPHIMFTTDQARSDPVCNLTATRLNTTSLTIQWTMPENLNGQFQTYTVCIALLTDRLVRQYNVTNTQVSPNGLFPYTPYEITVVVVNGAGEGERNSIIEFTVEGAPVSHPQGIIVRRVSSTAVNVSWSPLTLIEAQGFITWYNITYWRASSDPNLDSMVISVSGNNSSTIIENLEPNSEYHFTVSAGTIIGASNTSAPVILSGGRLSQAMVIAGAVAGALVAVVLLALLVCIIYICRKRRQGDYSQKIKSSKPKPKPKPPPKPKSITYTLSERGSRDTLNKSLEENDTSFLLLENKDSFDDKDIPVVEFAQHVKDMHRENNQYFEDEYRSIRDKKQPWEVSQLPENITKKNRFTNIFPYDHSRVKLQSTGEPGSDYINASWMNGYKMEKAYIAAQGPMVDTVSDFWRMIWEHKLPTIVMVTKLIEGAREKCQKYWPDRMNQEMNAGAITITLREVTVFTDYEIRVLSVENESDHNTKPFLVTHFYYLGWPDHGVPEYATSILGFLRRVRKAHPVSTTPLLVHCSAGVGRTGTFIALDAMLQQIHEERVLNVGQFVRQLRESRCLMVQTLSQYVFIHDALDEFVSCGDTEIAAHNLNIALNQLARKAPGKSMSGFEEQFQLLEQVCRQPTSKEQENINSLDVGKKNRYPNRFPYDAHQPKLTGSSRQEQYINASFIDGYKNRKCFVAVQAPLENTVMDFWKMAGKLESRTIVMLCDLVENGKEMCARYWPDKIGEEIKYGKIIIKMLSEKTEKDVTIRKLELSPTVKMTSNDTYLVTIFHFKNWNEYGTQPKPGSVLHLNDLVINSQRTTGNKSIMVMCNDGCGRTGAFMSVYSTIDRFKVEAVLDVFQCVKAARIQRMALVTNVEQYILIYDVIKEYMNSFDQSQYANFI